MHKHLSDACLMASCFDKLLAEFCQVPWRYTGPRQRGDGRPLVRAVKWQTSQIQSPAFWWEGSSLKTTHGSPPYSFPPTPSLMVGPVAFQAPLASLLCCFLPGDGRSGSCLGVGVSFQNSSGCLHSPPSVASLLPSISHCVTTTQCVYHPLADGYSDGFRLRATGNNAAVNIPVLWSTSLLNIYLRGELLGYKVMYMFNFRKILPIFSPVHLYQCIYYHWQCRSKNSSCSTSLSRLSIIFFFFFNCSSGCLVVYHCDFNMPFGHPFLWSA